MDAQLMRELEELGGEILPNSLRECDEIIIDQPSFSARIALWGGHLRVFVPAGQPDLLFQSANEGAQTRLGVAILRAGMLALVWFECRRRRFTCSRLSAILSLAAS